MPDKNHKLLNKLAAQNHISTAHSQYAFRQSHKNLRLQDPTEMLKTQKQNMRVRLLQGLSQRRYTTKAADIAEGAFGRSTRPQTPMRTVLNGVYGAVASFEISNKNEDIRTKNKLEIGVKPSRKPTRASSLAQESVLRNTLTAGLKR